MNDMLNRLDRARQQASRGQTQDTKSELGQYMTPSQIANFMASLFNLDGVREFCLLDAGAGIGSLTATLFERLLEGQRAISVSWCGYEIDEKLGKYLQANIEEYCNRFREKGILLKHDIRKGDFIEDAVERILFNDRGLYNFAILNPPYKKINSGSRHRLLLREVGIETVNLYTAFLALVIDLMQPGGQVVAIVPRSFCNGPYYKQFRERLLLRASILQLHLFGSRDKAFREESVLQENIILYLRRGGEQGSVKVSTSSDGTFSDYKVSIFPFDQIVNTGDQEKFIHIPTTGEINPLDYSPSFQNTLAELRVEVSTGPVVDFRATEFLRSMPEVGTVPLLYPSHFSNSRVEWPKKGRKPNALVLNDKTKRMLYPNGFYVVVRRFSSKEERRRIVASVLDPTMFQADWLGLENHLNVFHTKKNGLTANIAHGLSIYLNSTFVDKYFRRFSGHTQVNATDLRLLKYPSIEVLERLGAWAGRQITLTQEIIDGELQRYV
ncbi:MAG: Eco57I restriction-modification methylase domain-containing protein [Anaerolineales bacterium]